MNTTIKTTSIVIALLVFSLQTFADQLEDGVTAYNQGDYETAFRLHVPLAEQGVAEAQADVGYLYEKGHGVPQNYAEAVRWYQPAALQDNRLAQFRLGLLYAKGHGVPQNFNEAIRLLNQATQSDDPQLAASAQQAIQYIQNSSHKMQQQSAGNQFEGFVREHPIATIVGGAIGAAMISDLLQGNSRQPNTQQTGGSQNDYEAEEAQRRRQEAIDRDIRCDAIKIGGSKSEIMMNGC